MTDDSSVQTYFLYDGLGSTTNLTDDEATVTGTYEYDVFGSVRAHSGADSEWSYTGEQNDATGLEYLRARYYDAAVGRFLSRDPFTGFVVSSQSLNRYPYVANRPVHLVDPWGLCGLSSWGDFADCFKPENIRGGFEKGGRAVGSGADWVLEHPIIPGHCFKLATASGLLGLSSAFFAGLPFALAGTGVGVPLAAVITVESEIASAAAGYAAYQVGKAAWDVCTGQEAPPDKE